MASLNMVQLIGNVGAEPEVRYMTNGTATTTINVATTAKWKDRETGEVQERTEWHRVAFFGRLAEIVGEYVHKGAQLYVQGELRTRKWTDKDKVDRYTTEVVADEMKMLDRRTGREAGNAPPAPAPAAAGGGFDGGFTDDIPY